MMINLTSYWKIQNIIVIGLIMLINACGNPIEESSKSNKHTAHGESAEVEIEKGDHGGRLLTQNDFTLELSIFETGVPPEFRAWASFKDEPLNPSEIDLKISLIRLGGGVDKIKFKPLDDMLRGDTVVYEPHSFIVNIYALHNGIKYNWQYDNFEGRTKIEPAVAKALDINTEIAKPRVLHQTINVFGKIMPNNERVNHISARFAGVIKSVSVSMGEVISKGKILASIESNGSLKRYTIKAPISGVVTQRNANVGEQAGTQNLFTITDNNSVWVDLSIFLKDQRYVKVGASVSFLTTNNDQIFEGKIALINVLAETNQTIIA
ncbi:Probable Co/Zn/Cd efflux system membrane fusion protein, partial [hydrothermal vent metagenome]